MRSSKPTGPTPANDSATRRRSQIWCAPTRSDAWTPSKRSSPTPPTPSPRTGQRIVTNLCIDQTTFERTATRLTGTDPGPDPRLATWWSDLANQPTRNPDTDGDTGNDRTDGPASYRCEGLDGRPVDPTEAVAATLLVGHIRRAVYGADSVAGRPRTTQPALHRPA
ncbi:MAG: hypothetical protein U0P45_14785 [Acidimicrobiales bacterium]